MSALLFKSGWGVRSKTKVERKVFERVDLAASAGHRQALQHPSIQKKEAKFGVE